MPNVCGAAFYLYLASALWVRSGEEGLPGGPGDAFYWALLLVPIVLAAFAFNVIAIVVVVFRSRSDAGWRMPLWFAVAVLWGLTLSYDQERSFRVIDGCYSTNSCAGGERSGVPDRRNGLRGKP